MNDTITTTFENDLTGDTYRAELTLEEAAKLKAGRPVGAYGSCCGVERFTLADQLAQARADRDQIGAAMDAMIVRFPHLADEDPRT